MQVGNYQILNEISRGSMGVIYKAHDHALDRIVAIKVMSTGNTEFAHEDLARFRREAQAMARIHHPHVVAIHGAGMANGSPYIVLDFVEGESLNDRLRRGPLKPRHAAKLARDLAAALECSHAEGVLHRDLKPANVLIDRQGKVLLTDFGLAKDMYDGNALTLSEMVLGTPAYMSPEQAQGALEKVGPRSDVYGLGAILYALLTGRPPIKGTVVTEVLERVISEAPPPPTSIASDVDRDLEAIVLRCLHKEPAQRYETMREFKDALRHYLNPPRAAAPTSATLLGTTVLGSVLGFALGVGVTLALWVEPAADPSVAPPPTVADSAPPETPSEPSPPDEAPPEEVTPPPTTTAPPPRRDDPNGPPPAPPEARDVHVLAFQEAAVSVELDPPLGPPVFGFPTESDALLQAGRLENALKAGDEPAIDAILTQLRASDEPWTIRAELAALAKLGRLASAVELLSDRGDLSKILPGFKGLKALDGLRAAQLDDSLQTKHASLLGGYWESTKSGIRASGKPVGPYHTSLLLRRGSEKPTGQYRLSVGLDLEGLKPGDSAGLVFAEQDALNYHTVFVRRDNLGELRLRIGRVESGTPSVADLDVFPFLANVRLVVDVAPRDVKVSRGGKTFLHDLPEPPPPGRRGLFRTGTSIVVYSSLSYEPR